MRNKVDSPRVVQIVIDEKDLHAYLKAADKTDIGLYVKARPGDKHRTKSGYEYTLQSGKCVIKINAPNHAKLSAFYEILDQSKV